jgi:hypothetical protein
MPMHFNGRFMSAVLLLLAPLILVPGTWARELCEDKSRFVAPCFGVHGRLSIFNGTPGIRIWKIGTKRVLGVLNDGDAEERSLPPELAKLVAVDVRIYGDFEVCPLTTQQSKKMQMVCLLSGKNLLVRKTP